MSVQSLSTESHSSAETEALAEKLGRMLPGGTVLALSGELGAGKTVFVRGLARGLGVPEGVAVTSPTYVLLHRYSGGRLTLHHIDAYRLRGGAGEFESSGLAECLSDPHGIVCIEWPERLGALKLPSETIRVEIEHLDPQRRRVTVRSSKDEV